RAIPARWKQTITLPNNRHPHSVTAHPPDVASGQVGLSAAIFCLRLKTTFPPIKTPTIPDPTPCKRISAAIPIAATALFNYELSITNR
ncbi:MAG: hypothetical protein LBQ31_11335, partial [Bacteroidales bacterium]|nr:hypothetical protein [Bacteroidales bacterium]